MSSNFPVINHIDEVLPYIEGRKDFIHVIKDGYQVVDYVYEDSDSFDSPIRRECRGLKFDASGVIIGRPLHKFFNYGQKLITYDWGIPHNIMIKMDGSMVHSALINGDIRLCTRMGITDQSIAAEKLVDDQLKDFLEFANELGYTVIMEYTSPSNQIVIEYTETKLTIIALRQTTTGLYMPYHHLLTMEGHGIEIVDVIKAKLGDDNIEQIREETTGIEGYVVSWDDGTRVKIKTDEYVQKHRAVSYFDRENMILPLVLDSQCDDIYPALSPERAARLMEYESKVLSEFFELISEVREVHAKWIDDEFPTRREYAQYVMSNAPKGLTPAYFNAIDGKDIVDSVKKCILANPDLLTTRWNV